jgi:hypothetical protein
MKSNKQVDRLSWWEARHRMAELCPDLWFWTSRAGDEAIVRALQRGNTRYQHRGCEDYRGEAVPLKNVIEGLQKLTLYPDRADAEYETTKVTQSFSIRGNGLLQTVYPANREQRSVESAWIRSPELIWRDLDDDLRLWELPAQHTRRPRKKHSTAGEAQYSGRQARPVWREIYPLIDTEIAKHGCPVTGDGKQAALERLTDAWLRERGWENVSESTTRVHVKLRINRFLAKADKADKAD